MRAFANEVKFTIAPELAEGVRAWARANLQADQHGAGEFEDAYHTTSLYLDTLAFDVFHRRASYGRAKYRIRRYGDGPVVFLERKLKRRGRVAKRRTPLALGELARLAHLTLVTPNGHWPGRWFERRSDRRQLAPVCQISYDRMARMTGTAGSVIRLTMDHDVRVQRASEYLFADSLGLVVPDLPVILELKYHGEVPAPFRELMEAFKLQPQPVSKYRLGLTTLGLVEPAAVEADVRLAEDAR